MINYGRKKAVLVLEEGTLLEGYSFGYEKAVSGEVVFSTGMIGYPENFTDPSYKGQILVMTYPLIGNYGVPGKEKKDGILTQFESDKIHLEGVIAADYSADYFHFTAKQSLGEWLKDEKIPAIYGIDTRRLTKIIREKGTMSGKILFSPEDELEFETPMLRNLVSEVSIKEPIVYKKGAKKIALVDCGVKNNIIRAFMKRNITVLRVPWDYDFSAEKVDGILLSNGPGDPSLCYETIESTRKFMERNLPILGICLGSQILGLASGSSIYKLKYGHRSHNQPCMEMGTKRCYITSQNHGYAIDSDTLSQDWREWFVNKNDGTNEGLMHISKPFFGTQFHPEASPGPDDTEFIFDMFVRALK